MITLKNILVPTDFSECGDAAVKYGRELAEHFGAQLHLLHVGQDPYRYAGGLESIPISGYDFVEQDQQATLDRFLLCSASRGSMPCGRTTGSGRSCG